MTWLSSPTKPAPPVWYVLYTRVTKEEIRIGPLKEEEARGMVSEWTRLKPELNPILEEWGPRGSWVRAK